MPLFSPAELRLLAAADALLDQDEPALHPKMVARGYARDEATRAYFRQKMSESRARKALRRYFRNGLA